MRSFIPTALALLISTVLAVPVFAATYTIDKDHTTITFTIRHLVSKVRGQFTDFSGKFEYDEKSPSKSMANVEIKTASIDTHTPKRDDHLRSPDFFDSTKFPDMTFTTKKVAGKGKNLTIEGLLKIRNVEKPVTLKAEFLGTQKDPWGNTRAGFTATAKINRKDFGLTWNKSLETGGLLVGDDVELNFDIEAIQEAPKAASN